MKFQKGNPGRPKGAIGKKTKLLKERQEELYKLIDKSIDVIKRKLDSPDEKSQLIGIDKLCQISEFIIPKQSRVESTVDIDTDSITFVLPKVED